MRATLKSFFIAIALLLLGRADALEAQTFLCCAGPTQQSPNCNMCHHGPGGAAQCLYEYSSRSCACGWTGEYLGNNLGYGCYGVGNCDYLSWGEDCPYEGGADNGAPACWPWEPRSIPRKALAARILGGEKNLLTAGT